MKLSMWLNPRPTLSICPPIGSVQHQMCEKHGTWFFHTLTSKFTIKSQLLPQISTGMSHHTETCTLSHQTGPHPFHPIQVSYPPKMNKYKVPPGTRLLYLSSAMALLYVTERPRLVIMGILLTSSDSSNYMSYTLQALNLTLVSRHQNAHFMSFTHGYHLWATFTCN